MCNGACICSHFHLFAHIQQLKSIKTGKETLQTYIYGLYICFQGSLYAYMVCLYAYMAIHTFAYQPSRTLYIYIYIYRCMQFETPKHHAQATSAAKSCSQHRIMIQTQSPPEATVGFY